MSDLVLGALGPVAIGVVSMLVYWDARRVGVLWPPVWAVLVFSTSMLGLGLFLFVPTVPVPGLLVIVLAGPIFYAFERDDTRHSGQPADPHTLADAETSRAGSNRKTGGETNPSTDDDSDGPGDGKPNGPLETQDDNDADSDEYADRR